VNASLMSKALAVAVVLFATLATRRWMVLPDPAAAPLPSVARLGATGTWASDDSLTSAAEATVANDPFRLANAPSQVRYDPKVEEGMQSGAFAPPPAPRPTLVLKAIVGGPPWQAVIDGLPGQPSGTVVREGSIFDKLSIKSVTRTEVIVGGMDTVWTLAFRSTP
jgi:hypothetical protein